MALLCLFIDSVLYLLYAESSKEEQKCSDIDQCGNTVLLLIRYQS